MSSASRTTEKADGQDGDTPPTTSQTSTSTSSISEISNKTISETSPSSLSPHTGQSSGSQTIAVNTTRSSTSLDSTSSLIPSTTTSVVFAKGTDPSTTVVNTITESPQSTLKSAVGVVVTQPDGHTTLSYPPLVTVLSTSLLPNGSYITFTHAVANPTGANEANGSSDTKSFFDNHGAVAGVFLAVGVILASIASCLFFLIRRRKKRRNSTERWIEDMQRLPQTPRYTDDPFVDQPPMSAVDGSTRVSTRSPDRFQLDDGGPLIPLTPTYQTAPVLMTSPIQRKQPPMDDGPFSDSNALSPIKERPSLPVDETHRSALQVSRQSTPSLYPPTDKDEYEDIDLDESIPPAQRRPLSDTSATTSRPTSAEIQTSPPSIPPRPPRSILRTPSKVYEPYTPPPSESNHSSSESPTTPVSDNPFRLERQPRPVRPISRPVGEDVFTRPTLLNVRPRSKGQ
ncbi:hypothetical protein L218DRAFT_12931 [Marasmius fiardii PR-910]|nr:hypothetical protein L218DRAFT_12931 [Marasmius fiardii PR-910]